ncbi:hypothetical protein BDZ45DRAFT_249394 [Acephala macrosclerotiorum]|nr:hypothetical protein BDZ45DRAFT_249394 [Acephala macrosclerotiorum]
MVIGKVASQFMRIASHVWKSVLDPRCLPRQIDCSADNVEALLILLHIAHLRFNDIPKVLGLMELTNLAVLCEKYECRDPVRHWSGDWIKYLKSKADAPTHFADDQWPYIACVFREKSIFDANALSLVKNIELSAGGRPKSLEYPLSLPLISGLKPRGLDRYSMPKKSILQTRTEMIQQLLGIPYGYIDHFNHGRSRLCRLESQTCDSIIYGSLYLQLGSLGLLPKKTAGEYQPSLEQLATDLTAVVVDSLPNIISAEGQDHSGCTVLSFKDAVDKIMSSIPSPVLDCHRKHIEKRSKSTIPAGNVSNPENAVHHRSS